MHQLLPVIAAAALLALQDGVFAAKMLRPNPVNGDSDIMDNEIPIIEAAPAHNDGRRKFVEIDTAPSAARHSAGAATELVCEVMGHPAPHIHWLKNDMPILEEDIENNEIIDESDTTMALVRASLIIVAVSSNKEDEYTCVAQAGAKTAMASAKVYNDIDSLPSMFPSLSTLNRHLLAAPQKPRITQYVKTMLGNANTNLLLTCRAFGNPTPTIYWHKNDNELILNGDPRIRVLESGDLLIAPARWADMGGYTCTAKNAFGKDSVTTFLYPVIRNKAKYNRNHMN